MWCSGESESTLSMRLEVINFWTRFVLVRLACLTLTLTSWSATSLAQLVTVTEPPADARITFPAVHERKPGTEVMLTTDAADKVTWAVLAPHGFRAARPLDDKSLVVIMPKATVTILADFGGKSQLLVLKPLGKPEPPNPDPPGPVPPPVPPTPDPVVPINVKNDYGFGHKSYQLAVPMGMPKAGALSTKFAAAAVKLFNQQAEWDDVWDTLWKDCDGLYGQDPAYQAWRKFIFERAKQWDDTATEPHTADEWIAAFREIQGSLEAVK